jgi:hypothetical protein
MEPWRLKDLAGIVRSDSSLWLAGKALTFVQNDDFAKKLR